MLISAKTDSSELLRVLGDPLRWKIITLLARETLCSTHLIEETGARQTNLSNHLKILREAGLVSTAPCGRFTYYSLRPEALEALGGTFSQLAGDARATTACDRKRPCP